MTTVTMVTGQQLKHHLQQSHHVGEIIPQKTYNAYHGDRLADIQTLFQGKHLFS